MARKIIHIIWVLLLVVVVLVVLLFTAIWKGWIGYVPPVEELENPISKYASQVVSSDGVLLGTWSLNENRIFAEHAEIAPCVFQALIATEDKRFYSHSGVDFYSVIRAIVKRGMMGNANAGGGSTITQQLAKQLYTSTASSSMERVMQKTIEWVIAIELERYYSKEEIMTLYLNYFDFLHHAVGIKTAAKVYFNCSPKDLTVPQAAMLIGMCKNPSYFNPIRNADRVKERRNVVLQLMEKQGYITKDELGKYMNEPVKLDFQRVSHKEGLATYLREYLRHIMMAKKPVWSNYQAWQRQEFVDDSASWADDPLYGWCNKNCKKDGTPYNIYTDGLKIHTTIDSRMQRYAEEAVLEHVVGFLQPTFESSKKHSPNFPFSQSITQAQAREIIFKSMQQSDRYRILKKNGAGEEEIEREFRKKVPMTIYTYHGDVDTVMTPRDSIIYYKSILRTGFMSMEPSTGKVKAYVGGLDYANFQYDMCMMGRRQVGSTIKPYLYSLAMENGYTPCDLAPNVQETYTVGNQTWTPRNGSTARYGEMVTLKWGLSQSNNWISAYLMSKLNPNALVSLLRTYGIRSLDVYPSMSLCLGTCDVSVGEMVSAYTAFVNKGIRTAPLLVTRIEGSDGELLATFNSRMNEVISAESSYKMLDMLQAVINQGTGGRLRSKYNMTGQIGGKTGTTNSNSDGWFMGFVPRLVSGCWVGGENRDIHFDTMLYGQGASLALPVWAKFMKKVYADPTLGYKESETFDIPAGFDFCEGMVSEQEGDLEGLGIDEIFQ